MSPVTNADAYALNAAVIAASVLGGALFTLIVGLILFFLWKRRNKKKMLPPLPPLPPPEVPPSRTSTEPLTVSTLYDFPLSQRDSSVSCPPAMNNSHLYEDLL